MVSVFFECRYDGKIKIDKNEVAEAKFIPLENVRSMLLKDESKFAPWTRSCSKGILDCPQKLRNLSKDKNSKSNVLTHPLNIARPNVLTISNAVEPDPFDVVICFFSG
jgi:hypothetical protein